MTMRHAILAVLLTILLFSPTMPVKSTAPATQVPEIHWGTLDAAMDEARSKDKLILVNVYTDWCGWCKIMDTKTYRDPEIVELIDQYFSPVRLNASYEDELWFRGYRFEYMPEQKVNQLAYQLLDGKLKYPTTIFMNAEAEILSPIQGYLDAPTLKKLLLYFGERAYLEISWNEFERNFRYRED